MVAVEFNNPEGLNDEQAATGTRPGPTAVFRSSRRRKRFGVGSIRSGSLEQSNVDLSLEFTNLIQASTGFSASSRVITTSNQLITELLNSSR